MARPKIDPYGTLNVQLYEPQLEWLQKRAHATGKSRAAIIRQAVNTMMQAGALRVIRETDPRHANAKRAGT